LYYIMIVRQCTFRKKIWLSNYKVTFGYLSTPLTFHSLSETQV